MPRSPNLVWHSTANAASARTCGFKKALGNYCLEIPILGVLFNMNKKLIYYKNLFESNNSKELIEAYKSLKNNIFYFFKLISDEKEDPMIIMDLWRHIKNGLLNSDGNIRNHAFYTFKRFRPSPLFFEKDYDLLILKELYDLSLKQKDKKIRNNLLRSIIEMSCIGLEYKAKKFGMLDEYKKIIKFANNKTKYKYEKTMNEMQRIIDQFLREMHNLE